MRVAPRILPLLLLLSTQYLFPLAVQAHPEHPPQGRTRALAVPEITQPPTIDGQLDETVWQQAAVADQFWISEQQCWPTDQTEVLVLTDGDTLYFGFRVYDKQPDKIEALQIQRDSDLGLDDQVQIQLDPYHHHRQLSSYSVNARGTQHDAIGSGRARNIAWKGDWYAATARTDYGWSAEIAIPFHILNYHEQNSTMGVNFVRYHHRTDEWSRWADITPQSKKEEMAHLSVQQLPEATPQKKRWTFMPYVLMGHQTPDKKGEIHEFLGTGGLDLRYEASRSLTAMFAFNPDFSQLETQFTDINFSYSEKERPDPRPFFQEGSAYFGSDQKYFYSNRIPDFDYGAKAFSQIGRYQIGGLVTKAPENRWDMAFRLERELDETSSASFMFVRTDRQDFTNQLAVGQVQGLRESGFQYAVDTAFTKTHKQKGDGKYLRATVGWQWDHWSVDSTIDHYSPNFFPANGLLSQVLRGTSGLQNNIGYYRDIAEGPLRSMTASFNWTGRNTNDGLPQRRTWTGGGEIELRHQIGLSLYYYQGSFRPWNRKRDSWSRTVNHDGYWTANLDMNTRSSRLGYGLAYAWGRLGGGDYSYLAPYLWAKPTARTFLNVSTERLQSFGAFEQTMLSGGWDMTDEDSIVVRYIEPNGDAYLRVAYGRRMRQGIDIFAVYDDEPYSPTKFSLKLSFSFSPEHYISSSSNFLFQYLTRLAQRVL